MKRIKAWIESIFPVLIVLFILMIVVLTMWAFWTEPMGIDRGPIH